MNPDVGAALAAAARSLATPTTLQETLEAIAQAALTSIPGLDAVGISTVDRHGSVETRAATGELVWALDKLQYGLGEGPCVETLREADVVAAPHIARDERWPNYVPRAVDLGLRSQLAVKLFLDETGTLGGLNMYSTHSDELDPDAEGIAELFATHAAVALGNARTVDGLGKALETRTLIGQALGLVMERYTLSTDAAFGFLTRTSSHSNVKLRDIAEQMVADANADAAAQLATDR